MATDIRESFALKAVLHPLKLTVSEISETNVKFLKTMVKHFVTKAYEEDLRNQATFLNGGFPIPKTMIDAAVSKLMELHQDNNSTFEVPMDHNNEIVSKMRNEKIGL